MFTPILDSSQRRPSTNSSTAISGEIEAGRLAAGERLPSKRALAAHLKISVVTVEGPTASFWRRATSARSPSGAFVQAVQEEHRSPAPARTLSVPAPPTPALPYDFSTSAVDIALFPFATWAKLMREVLSEQAAPSWPSPTPRASLPCGGPLRSTCIASGASGRTRSRSWWGPGRRP